MKVQIGVDSESGLIRSVETTAANVHDLTPAAELMHGEETVVYAGAPEKARSAAAQLVSAIKTR
jgi:IS5 family transposase